MSGNITAPNLEQIRLEFEFIQQSQFEGVNGVWFVNSGKPGPVLGITMQTHGNEPSGVATLWYFRNRHRLKNWLTKGSVFFVLNNLEAAKRYFDALLMDEGEEKEKAKRFARFCDHNMNRLPENTLELISDNRYEIKRAQQLRRVWENFDVGFDIHSTSKESKPMIVACGGLQEDLMAGFPIEIIITNIENVQVEKPAVSFYGTLGKTRTIAIEAGSHENQSSFVCSIACTKALLQNLGMIGKKRKNVQRKYSEYFVDGSVLFPHPSFQMTKIFEMFEPISKGQVLAEGKGTKIVACFDGHALMGPKSLKPDSIKEEIIFLSRPVRSLKI